jgi:glycosyltransferase involved in cell wall biosynthesis
MKKRNDNLRIVVAVLGMHRSGTSAIARALSLLGVELGSKLHPPGFDNPKGFWEDSEVLAINEDLLKAINSSYDQLDLAWDGVSGDQEAINDLRIRATTLLGERLTAHAIWGFKDPRTCRLIRFWRPIIESSGAECRVVLALRNPLSSAISLQKRNGLPIEKGCFLWLQHVLPSVLDPLGRRMIVVDYDLLMQSPFKELTRMASGLGLPLAAEDAPAVAEYVQDFLDSGLRHTHFSLDQTALDSRMPSDVLATYETLLEAARDVELLDSRKMRNALLAIQNRLAAYSQSFGYAKSLEEERHRLYLAVNERDKHLSQLDQEIAQRNEIVVRMKETESELNEKIRLLDQMLEGRAAAENEVRSALRESEARLQHLNVAIADIKKVAEERTAAELEARSALRESEAGLQQLNVAIADIKKVAEERTAAELEARSALRESEARLQQLNLVMSDIKKVADERTAAELQARSALHQSETRLQQLSVAMAEIQNVIGERTAAELTAKRALLESEARFQHLSAILDGRQREVERIERLNAEGAAIRESLQNAVSKLERREVSLQVALDSSTKEILVRDRVVADRDYHIARLYACVSERDARVADMNRTLKRNADLIEDMKGAAVLAKARIHELENALEARNQDLVNARIQQDELARQNESLNHAVNSSRLESQAFRQGVADREREIAQILGSASWRITRPIRFFTRASLIHPTQQSIKWLSDAGYKIWWNLPIESSRKQRLKNYVFSAFPFFFSWSQAYRSWKSFTAPWKAPVPGEPENSFPLSEIAQKAGPDYVPIYEGPPPKNKPVRLICFFLPQFHAIPENDEWWGEGFTEWTNVRPALPQFEGHYQPRIPGELGYYNLLDPGVQARQVELAKLYGIEGFCFYFYWFGGKRLLDAPIANYLKNEDLDFPFCLCWANENWSRRWDGLDSDILIAQSHSAADDHAFIAHVAEYMRDRRYIRIGGNPLLLVYRPSLLPDAKSTAKRWRDWCRENGIGEIFLAYTQSFETVSPKVYGFDAAIEFPPNNSAPPNITESVVPLQEDFGATVYDWTVLVERSERYTNPGYKIFRSVCPSWDNTARRKNGGTIFANSSPSLFEKWLANAIEDTVDRIEEPSERVVFINAWNEWAEGAYLEPDKRYGYAWLNATRKAQIRAHQPEGYEWHFPRKYVLVTHDAHPHGAQFIILNIARELVQGLRCQIEIIALGEGMLLDEFARYGTVHQLSKIDVGAEKAQSLAKDLAARGYRSALVNTTVSGHFVAALKQAGMRCLVLVHELRDVIISNGLQSAAAAIGKHADKVIFPAREVMQSFGEFTNISTTQFAVRPQGLYKVNAYAGKDGRDKAKALLRDEFGLTGDATVVLGVGYMDSRKGTDFFVQIASKVHAILSDVHFVWLGHWDPVFKDTVSALAQSLAIEHQLHFVGRKTDTDVYYAGADVFALTSREDPFPSVVMEAMSVGLPVIAFDGSGGSNSLVEEGIGTNVRMGDCCQFAKAIVGYIESPSARASAQDNRDENYPRPVLLSRLCPRFAQLEWLAAAKAFCHCAEFQLPAIPGRASQYNPESDLSYLRNHIP